MKTPIAVLLTVVALSSFNTAFAGMTGIEGDNLRIKAANGSSKILKKIQAAANSGDAVAEFELGVLYDNGQGVPQDYGQAEAWYRKAAEQGYADAQSNLGVMYDNGQGVPQDYVQAASWYRKAADQGNADAQTNLGALYDNGQGVPQDYAQAASWYRMAADQGNADAQTNLGVMYQYGKGVAQDYIVAYALYNLSASIDSSDDKATNNQNSLVEHMTSAQIEAGHALTREISTQGNLLKELDRYLAHR